MIIIRHYPDETVAVTYGSGIHLVGKSRAHRIVVKLNDVDSYRMYTGSHYHLFFYHKETLIMHSVATYLGNEYA